MVKTYRSVAMAALAFTIGFFVTGPNGTVAEDKFPSKPITILVGFSVGGSMDTAARLQGQLMSKILGVPFTIRNVPGAGGRNAVTLLSRAKPDGYTMAALNVPGQAVNQVLRGMTPDLRSFTWIGRQASNPYFLQTSKKAPWASLKQMKAAKEPIKAGITGTGGNTFPISVVAAHVVGYPVNFIAGFKAPELITGIIRGDIAATTMPLVTRWYTAVKGGDARAIAVYLPERHPKFPEIPTGVEQGFAGLGQASLVGQNLYALPPNTPPEIAKVLEEALAKVNNDPQAKEKIEANGNIVNPLNARDAAKMIDDMIALVEKNRPLLEPFIKK